MFIFDYHDKVLCAESIPLTKIAAEVGTPFYCYSTERLKQNYQAYLEPFADLNGTIHYAMKANPNISIVNTLAEWGSGAAVNSAGELERALNAGINPEKIVFNGVGKSRDEVMAAILARIHQINVESISELRLISQVALTLEYPAPVVLRINNDADMRSQKKTNGHKDTKAGIDLSQMAEAIMMATTMPGLEFKGLAVHVSSHAFDYEPFLLAYQTLAETVKICRSQGIDVERVDLGGGIGLPGEGQKQAPFADYAAIVRDVIRPLNCAIAFEPGRRIVGDAGIFVTRVVHTKKTPRKNFVIVDAGMNDFIRPVAFGERHAILPVSENTDNAVMPTTVAGSLGDVNDIFGDDYFLPSMEQNDLVAFLQAGAYSGAMSSAYGGRAIAPEVVVAGDRHAIARRRVWVAEQMSWEMLPPWSIKAGTE